MKKLLLILIMTSLMMPMMMAATQTMKIYPSNDAYVVKMETTGSLNIPRFLPPKQTEMVFSF